MRLLARSHAPSLGGTRPATPRGPNAALPLTGNTTVKRSEQNARFRSSSARDAAAGTATATATATAGRFFPAPESGTLTSLLCPLRLLVRPPSAASRRTRCGRLAAGGGGASAVEKIGGSPQLGLISDKTACSRGLCLSNLCSQNVDQQSPPVAAAKACRKNPPPLECFFRSALRTRLRGSREGTWLVGRHQETFQRLRLLEAPAARSPPPPTRRQGDAGR